MDDNELGIFYYELLNHCNRLNAYEFEFVTEMWGVMWMPWFIYLAGESLNFSSNAISTKDLNELLTNGKLELVKEFARDELETIEISKTHYRVIR